MDERRKLWQVLNDMVALWDMPDQDEAKALAPKLLVEAINIVLAEHDGYHYALKSRTRTNLSDIVGAYESLIDGVRYSVTTVADQEQA